MLSPSRPFPPTSHVSGSDFVPRPTEEKQCSHGGALHHDLCRAKQADAREYQDAANPFIPGNVILLQDPSEHTPSGISEIRLGGLTKDLDYLFPDQYDCVTEEVEAECRIIDFTWDAH